MPISIFAGLGRTKIKKNKKHTPRYTDFIGKVKIMVNSLKTQDKIGNKINCGNF